MFWDKLVELCKNHNLKPNQLGKEMNISSASFTKWKNGAIPNAETLMRIADFFNVSVDYLLGRSDHPVSVAVGDVQGSNNTIQNGNNNVAGSSENFFNNSAVSKAYEGLSEREKLAVQMFILDTAEGKK